MPLVVNMPRRTRPSPVPRHRRRPLLERLLARGVHSVKATGHEKGCGLGAPCWSSAHPWGVHA